MMGNLRFKSTILLLWTFFAIANCCLVDPAIARQLEGTPVGTKLSVIVTFKSKPDLLKEARDPSLMMQYFQAEFLPNLANIKLGNKKFVQWLLKNEKFFEKAKRNNINVESFKKSYLCNVVRGYYVYQTMKKASNLVDVTVFSLYQHL
jgi:hypothetical protein